MSSNSPFASVCAHAPRPPPSGFACHSPLLSEPRITRSKLPLDDATSDPDASSIWTQLPKPVMALRKTLALVISTVKRRPFLVNRKSMAGSGPSPAR